MEEAWPESGFGIRSHVPLTVLEKLLFGGALRRWTSSPEGGLGPAASALELVGNANNWASPQIYLENLGRGEDRAQHFVLIILSMILMCLKFETQWSTHLPSSGSESPLPGAVLMPALSLVSVQAETLVCVHTHSK